MNLQVQPHWRIGMEELTNEEFNKVRNLVIGAKKYLEKDETWTTKNSSRVNARDEKGEPVDPWDPKAQSFCVEGAIQRARRDTRLESPWIKEFAHHYLSNIAGSDLGVYNNKNGREAMLKVFENWLEQNPERS